MLFSPTRFLHCSATKWGYCPVSTSVSAVLAAQTPSESFRFPLRAAWPHGPPYRLVRVVVSNPILRQWARRDALLTAGRLHMAQQQRQLVKRTFKTPEGRFQLIAERPNGCSFSSQRPTRLTFARLFDGQHENPYVLFNVQECLHICYYSATEKVGGQGPAASVMHCMHSACHPAIHCTAHMVPCRCPCAPSALAQPPAARSFCRHAMRTPARGRTPQTCSLACPPATVSLPHPNLFGPA